MPVLPNALERLFLRSRRAPSIIVDVVGAGALRAAAAGVRFGVFDALRAGPRTASEVAHSIGASETGTGALLEGLVALGFLRKKSERYSNSPGTAAWLTQASPTNWATVARWWEELVFRYWDEHLEESIRRGAPLVTIYEWLNGVPDGWRIAQRAFAAYARPIADLIASKVPVPANARSLVDVGGGHGLYAIAFCRRYPHLTAAIVDLPEALEEARENIVAEGMRTRFELRAADVVHQDLGTGYDVALLFAIVHGFVPSQNLALLRNVAKALNPGGLVAILDQDPETAFGPVARAFVGTLGLTYFAGLGGRIYPFPEIARWLRETGFGDVRRIRIRRALSALILATKSE